MAIPLLYGGYLLATTIGRVAIPVIARYVIKNGVKRAAAKYGAKVIANAKVVKSIKNVKARSKVKYVAKTAKAKNIASKVKAKDRTVRGKSKPKPIVKPKPKVTSKSKPKTINPRTKPKPVTKAKPKVTSKSKPKEIVSRTKPKPTKTTVKPVTKATKVKPRNKPKTTVKPVTKATKPKPRNKPKPVSSKSKPKPITKPVKTAKPKVNPKSKPKPVKPVSKPKPVVKGKPKSILPIIVGGGLGGAALIAALSKKDKGSNITIKRKDKPSPDPKKSIGGTGRGDGALEFARRSKDAAVKSMKAKQSLEDRKLYNNRVDTYESRIRALVKQKDKLTKIQSGDGRNEYQVRINKLKKENPKEFRKLFKLGGFGNLKD